jgi:acyl phosphate:glycerol-3-phosphate acyltransferase
MNSALTLPALIAFGCGYLLGSIPFGLLLTRWAGLGDVRTIGSGNIGATNVLRTGHKGLAALTLLLDALKGYLAVIIAFNVGAHYGVAILAGLVAGLGAFVGHIHPVWLGFKGGKGVATYIGVALGIFPLSALVFCLTWLVVALGTRYSSLSALIACALTPFFAWSRGDLTAAILLSLLSLLLIWKHRANIDRLTKGLEPKIGAKA